MRILVVGAKGMLGTDLCRVLKKDGHEIVATDVDTLDFTQLAPVLDMVEGLAPALIVNCAAYTNVDGCETAAEAAYRVNAIGPKNLAIAANRQRCPLVHISTDYIFDGKKGSPYWEDDPANPMSVYGKSKLAGENNVRTLCNQYYLIRTQWLYGKNGKNFVDTMLGLARGGASPSVVEDQFGSPTYTKDLAAAIACLIRTPDYGVFHLTNTGVTTWYEFAREIFSLAGFESGRVSPCSTAQFPRPAPRPAYSPLENLQWRLGGYTPLRPWQEALHAYLDRTKDDEENDDE